MKFFLVMKLLVGDMVILGEYDDKPRCDAAAKEHTEMVKNEQIGKGKPAQYWCVQYQAPLFPEPRELKDT